MATRSVATGVVPADSSVLNADACMQEMTAAQLVWTATAGAAVRRCHLGRSWLVLRTALIRAVIQLSRGWHGMATMGDAPMSDGRSDIKADSKADSTTGRKPGLYTVSMADSKCDSKSEAAAPE